MDNHQKLEHLFEHARSQKKSNSTLNHTKDLFVKSVGKKVPLKVTNLNGSAINLFKILIMISLTSVVVICTVLFFQGGDVVNQSIESNVKSELIQFENDNSLLESDSERELVLDLDGYINIDRLPINTLQEDDFFTAKNGYDITLSQLASRKKTATVNKSLPRSLFEDEYRFPVLTPDEIKANNKQKRKMVKVATKLSELRYIPSGTFDFEGQKVSVTSFLMQQGEVSNIEYRTFLFDLLINGRKEDFLKAKPDQEKWTQIDRPFMAPMKDMYFSHPAYDDYPVVNVSITGAEMYCEWLTKSRAEAHPTTTFNDFRIPSKAEWMIAATAEGKNPVYPWGNDMIVNAYGCFLANFDYRLKDSVFWRNERLKIMNPEKSNPEKVYKSDGAMCTAKVITYNPSERGLYNLSGNVAELVYVGMQKSAGTCGGGWMNSASEVKLNAPDPYKDKVEAHPNIGFRVVMSFVITRD